MYISKLQIEYAKMVTQTIKKRGICPRINISSAKMVTHIKNNFCHNSR